MNRFQREAQAKVDDVAGMLSDVEKLLQEASPPSHSCAFAQSQRTVENRTEGAAVAITCSNMTTSYCACTMPCLQVGKYLNGPMNRTEAHELMSILNRFSDFLETAHKDNAERDAKVRISGFACPYCWCQSGHDALALCYGLPANSVCVISA